MAQIPSPQRKWRVYTLPHPYHNLRIQGLFVEILDNGPVVMTGNVQLDAHREILKKNHVVMRVIFSQTTADSIRGARISAETEWEEPDPLGSSFFGPSSTQHGNMYVSLIDYVSPSHRSLKTVQFPHRSNLTLGELLNVALIKQMHFFRFNILYGNAYMGCRDFMTQFFYQLEQAGIVSPTSVDGSGTFYNIIRHRYTPTPGPNLPASGIPGGKSLIVTPHWIERGIFLAYNRIYTAAMDYAPRP